VSPIVESTVAHSIASPPPSGPIQWPFVGLAVVLVLSIAATPWLLGLNSGAASSPDTEAILTLYHPSPSASNRGNSTSIVVQGLSTTLYAWIDLEISKGSVPYPLPSHYRINWTTSNITNAPFQVNSTNENPFAINVTAEYVDSNGGTVEYFGAYLCNVTGSAIFIAPITLNLSFGASSLPLGSLDNLPLLSKTVSGGSS
jgi:hypothetical protein